MNYVVVFSSRLISSNRNSFKIDTLVFAVDPSRFLYFFSHFSSLSYTALSDVLPLLTSSIQSDHSIAERVYENRNRLFSPLPELLFLEETEGSSSCRKIEREGDGS